ncbi:unnamed protein product, partial [Hapterophycus canaliculatus]
MRNLLSTGFSSEYDIAGVTDPFLQVGLSVGAFASFWRGAFEPSDPWACLCISEILEPRKPRKSLFFVQGTVHAALPLSLHVQVQVLRLLRLLGQHSQDASEEVNSVLSQV